MAGPFVAGRLISRTFRRRTFRRRTFRCRTFCRRTFRRRTFCRGSQRVLNAFRGSGFLLLCVGSSPALSPSSRQKVVSLSQSSCVSCRRSSLLTGEGGWVERSQIIRTQKNFRNACYQVGFCTGFISPG